MPKIELKHLVCYWKMTVSILTCHLNGTEEQYLASFFLFKKYISKEVCGVFFYHLHSEHTMWIKCSFLHILQMEDRAEGTFCQQKQFSWVGPEKHGSDIFNAGSLTHHEPLSHELIFLLNDIEQQCTKSDITATWIKTTKMFERIRAVAATEKRL